MLYFKYIQIMGLQKGFIESLEFAYRTPSNIPLPSVIYSC